MTSRRDSNPQPDDAPLHIVGHRLHKVKAADAMRVDADVSDIFSHAPERTISAERHSPSRKSALLRQVVLVDREIDALRDLAVALREEYDFHITISGNEALNLLRSGAIDTIVIGQTLYSSTGLNVLAEARRLAPNTRRVLLANAVEATAIETGPDVTPFRVLERPCSLDKLRSILENDKHYANSPPASAPEVVKAAPKPALTTRTEIDTHDPADFEHVVLESIPEPRRKPRVADEALQSLPVIVYTDNAEFHRTISVALKDRHNVRLCTQLERAAEFAEMGQCPLLITDRAATQVELQRISIALRALDAGTIVIAAGSPDVGAALRKLLGTGALHSFLTMPLNVPLVRLAVESGKRQYLQTKSLHASESALSTATTVSRPIARAPKPAAYFIPTDPNNYGVDDYEESPWRRAAPIIGIVAIVIAALGIGGWYWWQQRSQATQSENNLVAKNIEQARQAFAEGRFATPTNNSAIFYYTEALKIAPGDATANQGLDQTIERILEQAEKALLDEKLDVATEAIATVRALQPKNNRLPFLESQLNKERKATLARENNRAIATNGANQTTTPTIVATRGEPSRPISNETQRRELVNRWIAIARQRIAQDRLLQPENDSAEYYLRQAERADPDNNVVRQSLRDVGSRLIVNARDALARQQFEQAKKRVLDATHFGADMNTVEKLQQEIDAAANSQTRGNYLKLVLQRTRDNLLFEPERDSAKYYLGQLQRLDLNASETEQATRAFAIKLLENVQQALNQNQSNVAGQLLNEVRRLGYTGPELTAAETRLSNARGPARDSQIQTVAAAPKAIKTVPPKFPDDAARAGIQGWVDVEFKITGSGDVADVAAIASAPAGAYAAQFERAAVAAIRQYKYESRNIAGGQTQRMVVRVQFKLN